MRSDLAYDLNSNCKVKKKFAEILPTFRYTNLIRIIFL